MGREGEGEGKGGRGGRGKDGRRGGIGIRMYVIGIFHVYLRFHCIMCVLVLVMMYCFSCYLELTIESNSHLSLKTHIY